MGLGVEKNMSKFKNVSKDIENSLDKFNRLINFIEEHIYKQYEDIER